MNKYNSKILFSRTLRDQRRSKWNTTILTIFITLLNLALTGISVYFNYFRISESLQARITWIHSDKVNNNDSVRAKIAVFNGGNRQALITKMILVRIKLKNEAVTSWLSSLDNQASPQLPIVIEPNGIMLIELKTPYIASDWFQNADQCDSSSADILGKTTRCVNLGISWGAVNSEGESFNGLAIIENIMVEEKDIIGFAPRGDIINLFKNYYDR